MRMFCGPPQYLSNSCLPMSPKTISRVWGSRWRARPNTIGERKQICRHRSWYKSRRAACWFVFFPSFLGLFFYDHPRIWRLGGGDSDGGFERGGGPAWRCHFESHFTMITIPRALETARHPLLELGPFPVCVCITFNDWRCSFAYAKPPLLVIHKRGE